jgi:hypothetical protein
MAKAGYAEAQGERAIWKKTDSEKTTDSGARS